ncbi:MAG: polysulfide reductase NrfD [Sutterellaceae bacterium]|nr:polysulfide reductase NrfD [Sutterellaceae bacterium]
MNPDVDFTIGLTEGVAWPWPIAVYLFLAGISGGALAIACLIRLYRKEKTITPLFASASVIAFVTIALGMVCLVADLTNPLFFWRILVFYNPTSVMSLGVMALLFFIPTTAILTVICCRKLVVRILPWAWLDGLIGLLEKILPVFVWVGLVFAVTICAYTGFLISALVRFPLINTAVLPALFVASGLSAGAAASKLVSVTVFGAGHHDPELAILHKAEWPVMAAEAFCIFMIVVALIGGNASAQLAANAFFEGTWAVDFWVGTVAIGFGIPLVLAWVKESAMTFYASALASIVGMMCLRLFILYAGQMNPVL